MISEIYSMAKRFSKEFDIPLSDALMIILISRLDELKEVLRE